MAQVFVLLDLCMPPATIAYLAFVARHLIYSSNTNVPQHCARAGPGKFNGLKTKPHKEAAEVPSAARALCGLPLKSLVSSAVPVILECAIQ